MILLVFKVILLFIQLFLSIAAMWYGHCGYELNDENVSREYKSCINITDVMCGLLQCESPAEKVSLSLQVHVSYDNLVRQNGEKHQCKIANLDVGKMTHVTPQIIPKYCLYIFMHNL